MLSYGVIDINEMTFRYVSAKDADCCLAITGEPSHSNTRNSFPIGFVTQLDLQEDLLLLRCSDRITLFSDGCSECTG